MRALVFAYGSNLDRAQMRARCPSAEPLEPAVLRRARLVFRGYSARWSGAVATVVSDPAAVVYGALYRLEPDDLARLDVLEGVPVVYERVRVSLCDVYGRRRRAQAYVRLKSGRARAPAPEYLMTILRAYDALGFDPAPVLRAAYSEVGMNTEHRIFVYGSLMRGLGNHRFLETARFVGTAHTSASVTLVDLGAFPGLIAGGTSAVRGEVYAVDDATLASLDRLESHPRFYRRHEITLSDGARVQAYLLPAERYASYPMVVGGDWRAHLGIEPASGAHPGHRIR